MSRFSDLDIQVKNGDINPESWKQFIDPKEDELRAKSKASQEFRAELKEELGEIPISIWKVQYNNDLRNFDIEGQSKIRNAELEAQGKGHLKKLMGASGKSVRNGDKMGVSLFPRNILEKLLKYYSSANDTVLDPCAGHNSRMQTTYELKRNYIGYDVSEDYMKLNREIAVKLLTREKVEQQKNTITLHLQSSERMVEANDSVDFIFTSPPYWDLEFYGDEKEQLGSRTYPEFLQGIKNILSECFRVLKTGKICAININDFRKEGKYYSYHKDIIEMGEQSGFEMHDVIIMAYPSSMQSAFAKQLVERKQVAKQHEYIIVFRKGDIRNPKSGRELPSRVLGEKSVSPQSLEPTLPDGITEEMILSKIEQSKGMFSREGAIKTLLRQRGGNLQ